MRELKETTFSPEEMKAFEPVMKVGMLATVNDEGLPHLTLITSLQASAPTQVVWGQFTEGQSKDFVRRNPKVGFLIMTMDRQLWRGKADFTHTAQEGPEYEMYNRVPMFRYNAYFGIHTVYYADLVAQSGREALPMGRVALAVLQTLLAQTLGRGGEGEAAMNGWTRRLLSKPGNPKFLAHVGPDGYPAIVPLFQARAPDAGRVIFSLGAFGEELAALPAGATVALFGISLDMEDVLVRGTFAGVKRQGGVRCGTLDVEWVYNSMPPVPGQIYPPVPLEPTVDF
jgi:hypothetical protein